jgi:TonB family protein
MSYKALLFCPDEKTARVVTQVLTDLDFRVEPCNEPFAAVKKLMAEHFDAIMVDCDNEQNAALLFKSAHNSGSNQASLAVAVVEGQAGVAKAFRIGANLVLTKPINVEQSKGTLRVARGLLRKTDAAKPDGGKTDAARPTAAIPAAPRPSVATSDFKRPPAMPTPDPRPLPSSLPAQAPPSPIPSVSASIFEVEDEPAPQPEPTEAALLESMPDPIASKSRPAEPPVSTAAPKEYPWQPIAKPAAGAMANALRRAAEASGRSETESSATNAAPAPTIPDSPVTPAITASMSSGGQAAAAAPARELPQPVVHKEEPIESPQVEAPAFSSFGSAASEPADGGSKKILIAAVVVIAALAIGYIGWTKMHSASPSPIAQEQTAPRQVPAQVQPPASTPVPSAINPSPDSATKPTPAQPVASSTVTQGPDITLATTETHPSAPKKQTTSIIASDTVVRNPPEEKAQEPMVVRSESSKPAQPAPTPDDSAQPPALGSLAAASKSNDQAISKMMSTTAVNLPRPVQQLKVSQGVSQGLLVKRVEPVYPPTARQMRIQGAVELLANIGKDGSIAKVKLISGDAVLSSAAIDAVKQWKYKPYYLNDQPVEIQTQITVNFKLP